MRKLAITPMSPVDVTPYFRMSLQNSVLTERLLVSERCALLGQATGRIAHEMANQLNVLPLIELIEDEYANDHQLQQLAEVARKTHERLSELINEVKAFMRFETLAIELKPLPLAESIHELKSFLRFNSDIPQHRFEVVIRSRTRSVKVASPHSVGA